MADHWEQLGGPDFELMNSIIKKNTIEFVKGLSTEEAADMTVAFMMFIEMVACRQIVFQSTPDDDQGFVIVPVSKQAKLLFETKVNGPRKQILELSSKSVQDYEDALRRN